MNTIGWLWFAVTAIALGYALFSVLVWTMGATREGFLGLAGIMRRKKADKANARALTKTARRNALDDE